MAFHVGQRVICVDDRFDDTWLGWHIPTANNVYTIRAITPGCLTQGQKIGFLLEEILNRNSKEDGREPIFGTFRFRPLTDRKSSISFTEGAPKDSEKWDNRKRVKVRS